MLIGPGVALVSDAADVDVDDVSIDVRSVSVETLADELDEIDSKALDTERGTFRGGVITATNRIRETFGLDEEPSTPAFAGRDLAIIHHLDQAADADDLDEAQKHAREAAQLFVDEQSEGTCNQD